MNTWNADIHLLSTYCFLSKEETQKFAAEDHVYLIKDVYEHKYENITGTKKIKLETNGMIASWMWFLQRNDVNLRNEWSNYTNWPYHNLPSNITLASVDIIPEIEEYLKKNLINIIGGCCGTTPAHISAIAELAEQYEPRKLFANI